ncbi:MAG: transcription/translation regulatory transformer protein RfaH [Pseudomonadales bacterium]|nr:transcription/translation regulatory transformer protein RfaH [Pseudomonadales bacterium]
MNSFNPAPNNSNADKHWYLVYSKPRQEDVAKHQLERQGYTTYLPKIEVQFRKGSDIRSRIEPFFPRYLFIELDQKFDDWSPIRSTIGVCGIVRFGGVPQSIPESLIVELVRNENSDKFQIVKEVSWNKGDVLEIEQGPFSGYRCIFQESKGVHRVSVLLDIIGKQTRALLNKEDLEIPQYV